MTDSARAIHAAYEFEFPIERGMILQFARAVGDQNPVYHDRSHARALGFRDVLAPPTFVMAADVFDPRYERRPDIGPEGVVATRKTVDAWLHVEQRFRYTRPVTAGEVLTVRRFPPREWTKQGRRGGRLHFVERVSRFVGADGKPVVESSWTDVMPEHGHLELSTAAAVASPREPVGVVVARELTRTQLVMYVGVAGDFHPLHHDDTYARAHGYPGVFAPGMLTMALTARAVTDALGDGVLRRFGGRLTGQVWPGATLRVALEPGAGDAHHRVTTTDECGRTVFTGEVAT